MSELGKFICKKVKPGMNTIFQLFGEIAIKNSEANAAIDETVGKASTAKTKLSTGLANIGKFVSKAAGYAATAAVAVGGMMYSLAENTRSYRTEMGKLDTAFVTSGFSSEAAIETYKELQSVLGETDQAVEAANHLAKLTNNEKDLRTWTDICTGVFATFGDSLPIEGLTESANETAKVGEVTGSLADALNWAGISEDDFNKKLAGCTTEAERQDLIMQTLNETYKAAAEQYEITNEKIIKSNEAHDNLNAAMAKLGDAAEPAITLVINAVAKLAEKVTPVIEGITNAVLWLGDAWETLKTKMTDISAKITVHNNSTASVASNIGTGVAEKTGNNLLGAFAEGFVNSFAVNPDAPWIPGFAKGLDYVPRDNFLARLHEGEAVLTKQEAGAWRSGGDVVSAVREAMAGVQFNVVLDSGVLVGQLAPKMDSHLGMISNRKGRGN
jgi:hypothetical protein